MPRPPPPCGLMASGGVCGAGGRSEHAYAPSRVVNTDAPASPRQQAEIERRYPRARSCAARPCSGQWWVTDIADDRGSATAFMLVSLWLRMWLRHQTPVLGDDCLRRGGPSAVGLGHGSMTTIGIDG